MNRIVIESAIRSRLDELEAQMEFCDESGRTLGYFVPVPEQDRQLYDWARRQFTDEEIQRARAESGGLTIDEVRESFKIR
jgi:hypothetical protein